MAKIKTSFVCSSCGVSSPKWQGQCHGCGEWNTLHEEVFTKEVPAGWKDQGEHSANRPMVLSQVDLKPEQRLITADSELNRVLGGGIVSGAMVLIGGEPGIGKSTLMLQLALRLNQLKVLYVSGEESQQQIKMRSQRMGLSSDSCYILTETSIEAIFQHIASLKPQLLIIDSIQTLQSATADSLAGSVTQIRECATKLIRFAKESHTPVFMIGHITKEGSLAGPKVLEHMVDTVLQFEGDRHLSYRILRTSKNRFGPTSELGIYEMQMQGLREVVNPSEILISQRDTPISGVAIAASLEGNRPLLIEIQALVSPAAYGTPQRTATGFDGRRLNMLLAVLEKRGGFRLATQDVFLNIAGGLRVEDPAIDLAVAVSIISSFNETPVPDKLCFAGEIGLGGEIRAVNRTAHRVAEASKLGFEQIYISKFAESGTPGKLQVRTFGKLEDLWEDLWG
ncbi:MAG: DNA repair protein RadA [Cyclobacteriaceae bacterium]|nr:DNA repair protein RadA [Cyclobacteriaceae bacterium]